jgi:inosose dehydratase
MIKIGNAPCSWGVEFADDPRNPSWRKVLEENANAGYTGI